MRRWPTKPLGDVAQVTTGNPAPQRPEDFAEDGFPFVRMQDVGRFGQTTCLAETKDHLSPSASARLKRFPAGSILVPKSGASIRLNHRAILGIEAHVVSHLAVIVPRPLLNTRFAYYWLCGIDLSSVAHQADLPSMKISDLAKLQIPVPPLAEQERIVKLLDEADELRKLRTQADRRATAIMPALFHEMFGDPDVNPKGFRVVPIGEVVHPIEFGISEALSSGCEYQPGRIAVLRIANITAEGTIDYHDLRYLKISDAKRNQLLLKKGELLFNWRNSPKWVGKTAIFDFDEPCIFASFLFRLRVHEGVIDRDFLWFYLNQLRRIGFFESKCRQAVSQANFGRDELAAVRIILPPLALQKKFAARVSEIRTVQTGQAASRHHLDDLYQSVIHRAFEGKL